MTFYSSESQLKETYWKTYIPYVENQMTEGNLALSSGISLKYRYHLPQSAKAIILVLPGRAESTVKYAELLFELYQNDYAVVIYDHRGQGESTRQCPNPQMGYVSDFEYYVQDACAVVDKVLLPQNLQNLPVLLLAHSMGAAIATKLLTLRSKVFTAAALLAPMYGIKAPIPKSVARIVNRLLLLKQQILGRDASYFIGQRDYQPKPFADNHLTSSQVRYACFVETHSSRPALQLGGVTVTWLQSAMRYMHSLKNHVSSISTPCALFVAGRDRVVEERAIKEIAGSIRSSSVHNINDAQHEILFERDPLRKEALNVIYNFFEHHIC
ncbi:alpha/beta fold hydrolase [Agaribacter flavus]|uniref:Alpha/beta fold hydrolase n=1 Tax=Agaribacter flavus TaxID=1902781 RepID=A0ABV7FSB9_9ALTE